MPGTPDNLDPALRVLAAGDLDALTPQQVSRLEGLLNSRPDLAAQLAGRVPVLEARLAAALEAVETAARPAPGVWDRVWDALELAAPADTRRTGRPGRMWRLWAPLTAVAACILMVGLWKMNPPSLARPWPMHLATDVEINELEVYGGATAFVVSTGGETGANIIWVLEDES